MHCHQGFYSSVEKVGVKCLLPGDDSILLVYICCKLHAGRCFWRGPDSLRSLGPILLTRHRWWNCYGWKVVEQHLYSPDLVPNDFHLFGPVKEFLAGEQRRWCEVSCLIFWLDTLHLFFSYWGTNLGAAKGRTLNAKDGGLVVYGLYICWCILLCLLIWIDKAQFLQLYC